MRTSTQAGGMCAEEVKPAYVSIRQHTSAYIDAGRRGVCGGGEACIRQHTPAYVSGCRRRQAVCAEVRPVALCVCVCMCVCVCVCVCVLECVAAHECLFKY
jgi:hypothetical protein